MWGFRALNAVANKEGGFGRFPIELGMTKGAPKNRRPQLDWGSLALDAVANKKVDLGDSQSSWE